jgi:chromosome partitioning protein
MSRNRSAPSSAVWRYAGSVKGEVVAKKVLKLAVLNQKGGVGKTTISVNLAYGLARAGKRTLLIDLDPQAHSSIIFCPDIPKDGTVKEVFERTKVNLAPLIRPAEVKGEALANLWIVPSNIHLAVTAERMISQHYRERRLDQALTKVQGDFDFIVLDCPPNLGVITVNAIYTADRILIPTTYGRYSLDGIADLFGSITEIREQNQDAFFILRNAYDARTKATNEYIARQLEELKPHLLATVIRRTEAINQAQISGEPVFTFDPKGYGAQDFDALTEEVLSRVQ